MYARNSNVGILQVMTHALIWNATWHLRQPAASSSSHREVFYELLAQVVVNAEHLVLCQVLAQGLAQLLEGGQIPAKGFFYNDARPACWAAARI